MYRVETFYIACAAPPAKTAARILWECKHTRTWSDRWLAKLRDDQRAVKAKIALIVSSALPNGVDGFGFIENIWVTAPRFAVPLAMVLRQSLVDLADTRLAVDGRHTKKEMVYQYLTGSQFRQTHRGHH